MADGWMDGLLLLLRWCCCYCRFQSSPLYRHVYQLLSEHALGRPGSLAPLVAQQLPLGFKPGHGTVYHAPTAPAAPDTSP